MKIGIIGLGYVGLPLAKKLAATFPVVGFDTDEKVIQKLHKDYAEVRRDTKYRTQPGVLFTAAQHDLISCDVFIVTVPTPVDGNRRPDLSCVRAACTTVGQVMSKGALVVIESTVYPGCTEGECTDLLSKISGLVSGEDFEIGFSPERINPGDQVHSVENCVKVIACESEPGLRKMREIYSAVSELDLMEADSIRCAEAAKLIENIQRDVNIALMNECAEILNAIDIDIHEVLRIAKTKWNFCDFHPGLVGGHCISVDPYYMIELARDQNLEPDLMATSRRVNDRFTQFLTRKLHHYVNLQADLWPDRTFDNVLIFGCSFKADVADTRNSLVKEFINELETNSYNVTLSDDVVFQEGQTSLWGRDVLSMSDIDYKFDIIIICTPHQYLTELNVSNLEKLFVNKKSDLLFDLYGAIAPLHTYFNTLKI